MCLGCVNWITANRENGLESVYAKLKNRRSGPGYPIQNWESVRAGSTEEDSVDRCPPAHFRRRGQCGRSCDGALPKSQEGLVLGIQRNRRSGGRQGNSTGSGTARWRDDDSNRPGTSATATASWIAASTRIAGPANQEVVMPLYGCTKASTNGFYSHQNMALSVFLEIACWEFSYRKLTMN